MNYRLDCPHCTDTISVSPAKAGATVMCNHCQQSVAVPRLGDLKQMQDPDQAGAALAEKNSAGSQGGTDSPFVVVALGMIATAALLVAGYTSIRWALSPVDATTETHLEQFRESYQRVPVATLIREYEAIEQYGLELPLPATYIKQAEIKRQWGTAAASSAVVGLLAIGGVAFSVKRRKS